jgi:hypothetical protein
LVFDRADWLILGGFIGLLATVTIAGLLTSTSRLWTPQFLIDLAGS